MGGKEIGKQKDENSLIYTSHMVDEKMLDAISVIQRRKKDIFIETDLK